MMDYNTGQAGTIFTEAAMQLNHVVLANKSRNKTRFVRSDFRAAQTYMINIPTIFSIQGKVFQECNESLDVTGAKVAKKYMDKLSNGTTLATMVGYCQFLELYVECSLTAQHAKMFPTTVLQAVMTLESQLEALAQQWSWFDDSLKFGRFGAPSVIVQDLLNGKYKPYIESSSAARSIVGPNIYRQEWRKQQQNIIATGMSIEDISDLLNWDPPVTPLGSSGESGEIPVEGFTARSLENVQLHMQNLARELHHQLGRRIKMWPLLVSALEGFGGDLSWADDENKFEENSCEKLFAILSDLTGPSRDLYAMDSCLPAYKVFIKFARDLIKNNGIDLERIWEKFYMKYKNVDMYENFVGLFQHVQIKSYSEALCETVGSIMKMHHGRGRNVHPVNFNKEIYLRFNLPPLHIMKESLISEAVKVKLADEKKSFIFQTARQDKLKFGHLSSSVGNFRIREDASSHLPIDLFKKEK